jgi:hypothetical protein
VAETGVDQEALAEDKLSMRSHNKGIESFAALTRTASRCAARRPFMPGVMPE